MTIIMNQILNKYKKSAYLSFQLIVHYKHLQINEDDIVLFLGGLSLHLNHLIA